MNVSIAEAQDRLPELIRAVEAGETVVLTRDGQPVAQMTPSPRPRERRKIQWGSMEGQIELKPGWDDPISEDDFLAGRDV